MKRLLLTSFLAFTCIVLHAQDQKWSVEANYPFVANSNMQNDFNGVVDLGIKYRFTNLGPVILGAGFNAAYLKNFDKFTYGSASGQDLVSDYKAKQFLLQPKLFAELPIPGLSALRPQIGIGYSFSIVDIYYDNGDQFFSDNTNTEGGLNLNLGLSYDISQRFFVQVQYDYINLNLEGESEINGQTSTYDFKEKTGFLKAGVGFRF